MRALIAGWFSFPWMGATAGDVLAADVVAGWLDALSVPHDRAVAETLGGDLDALSVDPSRYTHLVFVCGPFGAGEPATTLFERFAHARLIGLDLSMLQPLEEWNPFDLLLERDSTRTARPDLSLLANPAPTPVIALVLVHEQKEYEHGRHRQVHEAVRRALDSFPAAVLEVDTSFDPPNRSGLRSPAEVFAVLGRADAVVTTRLHGLVLGLKAGVPVVAIDPVAGGAKIRRQAETLGWDLVLTPEEADPPTITAMVERALRAEARSAAATCVALARQALEPVEAVFAAEFHPTAG